MDSTQTLLTLVETLQRISNSGSDPSLLKRAHENPSPGLEELFGTPVLPVSCMAVDDTGAQRIEDTSRNRDVSDLLPPSQASLRDTARHFPKKRPVSEVDLQSLCSMLRKIIESTLLPTDCAKIAYMGPELDKIISLIKPIALLDMRVAVYICSVLANLAAVKESRIQLNAVLVWDFLLSIAQKYVMECQVLQLVFVTISNLAFLEQLRLTRENCELLCHLILPGYTDVHLVESWVTMLCSMTAHHPETVQLFVGSGVVELLQRLVLYIGAEGKTAIRAVQCLANLAEGFTNGHVSALRA